MPAFQSSEEPHRSGRAPPFGGCCVLQLGCVVMRQGKLDRQISCSDIWVFVYWCCMMIELRTCLNFTLICCSYWFHTEPRTKEKCNTANTDFSLSPSHINDKLWWLCHTTGLRSSSGKKSMSTFFFFASLHQWILSAGNSVVRSFYLKHQRNAWEAERLGLLYSLSCRV